MKLTSNLIKSISRVHLKLFKDVNGISILTSFP